MATNKYKLQAYLDKETHEKLARLAEIRGKTLSKMAAEIIVDQVDEYLNVARIASVAATDPVRAHELMTEYLAQAKERADKESEAARAEIYKHD